MWEPEKWTEERYGEISWMLIWWWWWWGNDLITGPGRPALRGTWTCCKIVAPGWEKLFIDWWAIICNIGQPAWHGRELLQKLHYHHQPNIVIRQQWSVVLRAQPPLCPAAQMINGVTLMLWRYGRYLRSTSTLEPGKSQRTPLGIFHISFCVDFSAQGFPKCLIVLTEWLVEF